MDEIAVLLPCYNEAPTIAKVVRDFRVALPHAVVYVYDNNSTDGTAEIAAKAGAVVRREYQQGKGNVVRRMFQEIDAHCYLMADGDDTYPAAMAAQMIAPVLERQADMVVGDRLSSTYFTENKRPFHNFGNMLVRGLINLLFHTHVRDVMTGYRAFSYRFVKSFPATSSAFEIETEMTIHAIDRNMAMENVVVDYSDRPANSESKLNTYADGFKVLSIIGRLFKEYRPLPFYGSIAAVLLLCALLFSLPVIAEYMQTGLVPRFPTLIVCCFTALAGLLSLFAGLIVSSTTAIDRRNFENRLMEVQRQYRALSEEKAYMHEKADI